jgi:pilus assembly protein CpaB
VTDVLLQNIRVIAIDQQAKNADGSPKVARTATLQVSPLDAQKLALAQEVGSLSLVLRKPGEQNNPVVETISMNDLRYNMYGGARYPAPAVVGSYGSGLGGAIAGSMVRAAGTIDATRSSARPSRHGVSKARKGTGSNPNSIDVYHGTKLDQVKMGG